MLYVEPLIDLDMIYLRSVILRIFRYLKLCLSKKTANLSQEKINWLLKLIIWIDCLSMN